MLVAPLTRRVNVRQQGATCSDQMMCCAWPLLISHRDSVTHSDDGSRALNFLTQAFRKIASSLDNHISEWPLVAEIIKLVLYDPIHT